MRNRRAASAARGADAPPLRDGTPPEPYAETDDGVVRRTGETVLGTYRIGEQLGAGGMGVVHRIRHRGRNEDLAVKSPRPELWASASGITAFVDEAEVWVGLPPHPHLCTCHYVRELGGVPRLFAEFVEGGTVAQALAAGRLVGLPEILEVAIQMAWGLRACAGSTVNSVTVAPDGRTALSSGFDKTVRRWDLLTGPAAPRSYSRPRSALDLGAHAEEFQHEISPPGHSSRCGGVLIGRP
ncbi:protein kinase [Streptomyces sp. NL15-2K]|uniref:protein kinase n=1 Tax=Streptomyces sp. NL15-2K TaxID=376149 RepID=UPI00155A4189|nr:MULTISPECIES: protein kinase [Actinomycetes]WKX14818.1 protein kinase [Kutzneria buriramensis]